MKVRMNKLTTHAKEDRKERRKIAEQVGIGNTIAEIDATDEYGRIATKILTDTGLIIVMSPEQKIVTLYLATCAQACAIYKRAYGNNIKMPRQIYKQIEINHIMFAC